VRILAALLFSFVSLLSGAAFALEKADLTVVEAGGQKFHFDIEIARTPEQQERGLMFRKEMAPDAGMIFPQAIDRPMNFWMKNTYIPLDMLFVQSDGRISRIFPDATPLSEATIESGGPIRAVIELNAGTAAKLGIHVGDRVEFPGLGGAQ
jgi:uncharacterized membrane protein (UPF0127 family)